MTEREWLVFTDPTPMLEFLRHRASDRKLRLLACACCRRYWDAIKHEEYRQAIEVAEKFADALCTVAERDAARQLIEDDTDFLSTAHVLYADAHSSAHWAFRGSCYVAVMTAANADAERIEQVSQVWLLRDIFGNPFRPIAIDPRCLTSTVVDSAQAIYNERAFERMPILADALMDAGCDNDEMILHCRGAGPHVRGCWVVDLLLGKESSIPH